MLQNEQQKSWEDEKQNDQEPANGRQSSLEGAVWLILLNGQTRHLANL
ncbi:MAG: hypothetical protein AAF483_20935 [Planctomycetota bacterium]